MKGLASTLATVFGVGQMRPAPGTWGSAAALPLFWVVHVTGGFALAVVATALVFVIGVWATAEATRGTGNHDPSEIVIDEVAGQWIALWPVSFGASMMGIDVLRLWPGWVAGFILFRLFDIWKPGPVGWADRRHDAVGVMLDDVIAGVMAAICAAALGALYHGVLM